MIHLCGWQLHFVWVTNTLHCVGDKHLCLGIVSMVDIGDVRSSSLKGGFSSNIFPKSRYLITNQVLWRISFLQIWITKFCQKSKFQQHCYSAHCSSFVTSVADLKLHQKIFCLANKSLLHHHAIRTKICYIMQFQRDLQSSDLRTMDELFWHYDVVITLALSQNGKNEKCMENF